LNRILSDEMLAKEVAEALALTERPDDTLFSSAAP
jgi:hypothetical protein